MTSYTLVVWLHVVSLMVCAGPVLVLALASEGISPPLAQRLAMVSGLGLLGLLLTGATAVAMTGPAFVQTWWLRLSGILFLVIGALTGRLRSATRKPGSARVIRSLGWTITAALVLVVYLMEAKPF